MYDRITLKDGETFDLHQEWKGKVVNIFDLSFMVEVKRVFPDKSNEISTFTIMRVDLKPEYRPILEIGRSFGLKGGAIHSPNGDKRIAFEYSIE